MTAKDRSCGAWRSAAACAGLGPELFFDRSPRSVAGAKRICASCPVLDACAEHAHRTGETFGMWGGRTEGERARPCDDTLPIVGRPRLISDAELVALLADTHPSTCASDVLRRHPQISTASVYRYLITALRLGLVEQRGRSLYPVRRA
jgi:WhiB family transcriptional regulator, redox-sensing transcriptional regulator